MAVSMGKGWKPKFLLQNMSAEEKEETISNVAWRMINIYRQLHIFTKEDIEKYNQLLLKADLELQMLISDYPGGAEVTRYLAYLKGQDIDDKKPVLDAKEIAEEKAKARILADALAEKEAMSGEKVTKIQIENVTGAVPASGANAFASALPPVPMTVPVNLEAGDGVSLGFDADSMDKLADVISKAIASSQVASANVMADAIAKLSSSINASSGDGPIDVSYSPVQTTAPSGQLSEAMDVNLLANFATDISQKIATGVATTLSQSQENSAKALIEIMTNAQTESLKKQSLDMAEIISNALSQSQENNTKALMDVMQNISHNNKEVSYDGITTAIAKAFENTSMKMGGSDNLEVSGATINADGFSGGGLSEESLSSFVKAFANAQIEVSKTQTADLAEAFSKTFKDAQIEISKTQTDNLADAFAKAVTLSQSDISTSLHETVGEILKNQNFESKNLSATDISEIISNAIDKWEESRSLVGTFDADKKGEMSKGLSELIEQMTSSFTKAQLELSQSQGKNIEKVLETAISNMSVLNEKFGNVPGSSFDKSSETNDDTYKEMWLGSTHDDTLDGDYGVNSDMFDGEIMDGAAEVSLKEALSSDPYNLLLKQKKVFKEHKVLYDSEVGLHIAYSGIKDKDSQDEVDENEQ